MGKYKRNGSDCLLVLLGLNACHGSVIMMMIMMIMIMMIMMMEKECQIHRWGKPGDPEETTYLYGK